MKQFKIILALILFASVTTFAQSPRIKLNQITKDTVKGSVLISSSTDSGMVYSRDFYIAYGADTLLILYGDTIGGVGGGVNSIVVDPITLNGYGTTASPLSVDTATISTIQGLVDSLLNYVTLAGTDTISGAKTFTSDLNVDAKIALNDGGNSIFIGDEAGRVDDGSDNRNVGIGKQSLFNNTSGYQNIAKGYQVLFNNTSGYFNIGNGSQALFNNTIGYQNIANGIQSLYSNDDGVDNIANGFRSLYKNLSGANNFANGYYALYSNETGSSNNGSGFESLYSNKSGNHNIGYGYRSLYSLSSGNNNQAYGYEAGRFLSNGTTALDTANGSLFLGSSTRALANNSTNEIVIGTSAIGNGSNTITIGSSSAISLHTRNYEFDIDQTVSATEDNYVLTYDNGDGQISLEPIALSGSATLDFGSTSAQSSADLTITVTGAADGDVVSLGVPNASVNANTNYSAWVSAANTVTVRFNNYSSGAVDPASGTFKVKVFK